MVSPAATVRGWVTLAALAASAAASLTQASPQDTLAACVPLLPEQSSSIEEFERACPGLHSALVELGAYNLLTASSRAKLARESLRQLADLTVLPESSARRAAPELTTLRTALASVAQPAAAQSWWERVKAWVLSVFAQQEQRSGAAPSWLSRWLSHLSLSSAVVDVLYFVLLGLVVAAAVGVMGNELRAAGLWPGRRRRRPALDGTASVELVTPLPLLAELPLAVRPAALLRMLVLALTQSRRLPSARSLTYREIARRARLDAESDRADLLAISALAERQMYGGGLAQEDEIGAALRRGAALLAVLGTAPALPP